MPEKKTKLVQYVDEKGERRRSILPADAPDTDAPLGIPAALVFPAQYDPVRDQLEAALSARGIVQPADLFQAGADVRIRQALQQVLRLDVQTIKAMNKE